MIIVWGSIEAQPQHLDAVIALSLEHVQRSRKEPGCIMHSVQVDVENPNRLVFYEQWQDMAALQTHFKLAESGEFVKQAGQLAIGAPSIEIFTVSAKH